jgi:ABC-type multidrug transport system ATPase subunit
MSEERLVVHGVTLRRDRKTILEDVSFTIGAGQTLALAGPNGGGKTSLLLACAGFHTIDGGEIRIGRLRPRAAVRRGCIGYVPQTPSPPGPLPVTPRQMLEAAGDDLEWRNRLMGEVLDDVPLDIPASRLSGGQRQLVGLCRSLVHRPKLLLLDEPTLGLSPAGVTKLVNAVRLALETLGVATVVATHDHLAAMRLSDRLLYLDRLVRYDGPADTVPADLDACLCHHE